MPAAIINGRLITKCDHCGGSAMFGFNVNLRQAMAARKNGQVDMAKKHLGEWFCKSDKTCARENQTENAS